MEAREALIALNMIEHLGPVRLRQLLTVFDTPQNILQASRESLLHVAGIGDDTANSIVSWEDQVDLLGELRKISEFGCRVISMSDPEYPEPLKEIYDPPIVLYVLGQLKSTDHKGVAVVGSRLTTPYGMDVARRISANLAAAGVTVVSGGARGIDTAAHQGAIKAGGRTIAVLGTGINLVFPPENAELFDRVQEQGAVITQFPFNRSPDRQTFPIRNRIVAGMTLGTLVIEANLTSGALITANMAVDFGRQVFSVPGRIDSPRSKGCHELIKRGAKLCECAEDVLSEFEYLFPPSNRQTSVFGSEPLYPPVSGLNEMESKIYALLGIEDVGIEELILGSGLTSGAVSATLLNLEIKRLARQLPGKRFVRIR